MWSWGENKFEPLFILNFTIKFFTNYNGGIFLATFVSANFMKISSIKLYKL